MLKSTEIGKPVVLGEEGSPMATYYKIIAHVKGAATLDDCISQVLISTSHGLVIKTGIFYLNEITEIGLKKLREYEDCARSENVPLYKGKLLIQ